VSGASDNLNPVASRVPPRLAERRRPARVWLGAGALALLIGGAILFRFDPAHHGFYPFCLFHKLTGLHCPGCGGVRALHQILHGNLVEALRLNALLFAGLAAGAWLVGRRVFGRTPARSVNGARWLWGFLAAAGVFFVVRNLPAFAWLSP
jgi:hypothetical protein